jgi:hypothetical protein
MKSGILREDEGYDIYVDGQRRTSMTSKLLHMKPHASSRSPENIKIRSRSLFGRLGNVSR